MIDIKGTITIERPPEEVFDFVQAQENAQLWLSGWLESRATSQTVGVGYPWVDVIEVFGRRVESEVELTQFEPPRQFGFKSIRGSFPIRGVYTFVRAEEGTDVAFDLEGEPGASSSWRSRFCPGCCSGSGIPTWPT